MPIYEYQCDACGHTLEALQKLSDDPLKECPACQKAALKKLISAAAFHLKGSGWYETDFKSKGKKTAEESTNSSTTADAKSKAGGCGSACGCHAPGKN